LLATYDGLGSRVSTLESGTLRYYDWDGINVIQEKDATNAETERQVHGYAPIPTVGDIALTDRGGNVSHLGWIRTERGKVTLFAGEPVDEDGTR
jgi:hypothetical protein